MAKLESLVVDLQVNNAQLRQGLDEAKGHMKSFADSAKEIGEKVHALTELVAVELGKELVEKLGEFVLKGAEAADRMGKLASAAQVPVETFERLAHAAQLGGVSTEEFGAAFNKLNKALGEAASGSAAQMYLFKALGVNLKDSSGRARETADIFKELASKLNEMAPGYAKATLEQQLFGRSGTQLDETLKNVASGMAEVGGEADQLGLVLSGRAIEAATAFHDNFERLKSALEGVGARVAAELAPALAQLTDQLLHSSEGALLLKTAVDGLVLATRVLISTVLVAVEAFSLMNKAQALVGLGIRALATGDVALFADVVKGSVTLIGDELSGLKDRMKTVWASNEDSFRGAGEAHKKMADGVLADIERMKNASKEMEERFKEAKALAEKLSNQHFAEGDTAHKTSQLTETSVQTQQKFENVGKSQFDVATQSTKGFQDFYDALEKYTQAQIGVNNEQAAVAEAKKSLDVEGYDFAMEALQSQEALAKQASLAVEGFQSIAEIDFEAVKARVDAMLATAEGVADNVLKTMGDFGKVVKDAIDGFKQGGWIGAIVAVIADVLARFQRFAEITDISNKVLTDLIETLKPGLNALVNGLGSFMRSIDGLVQLLGTTLNPVLGELGRVFGHIGRILGFVMDAIGPVIDMVGNLSGAFQSIADVLEPMQYVLKLVGALLKLFGIAMLEISNGLQTAIAWAIGEIKDFVKAVIPNSDSTVKFLQGLQDQMTNGAKDAQAKAEAMWKSIGNDFDHFFDSTDNTTPDKIVTVSGGASDQIADLGDAAGTAATAMDKMTQELTNVPQGFRIAAATFGATALTGSDGDVASLGRAQVNINVAGSLVHENQLIDMVNAKLQRQNFVRKGTKKPP